MNKFINEKLMPPMMKFLNTKAVTAIKTVCCIQYLSLLLEQSSSS